MELGDFSSYNGIVDQYHFQPLTPHFVIKTPPSHPQPLLINKYTK